MPAPLVSVLVPAWNAGRTITRALDSVLADPDANVQVVVVDDASTDDTTAVVEAIAARDPRVELVRSPANSGPSAARNLGLPRLRGEWMTFLDSDDRLLPGGLAALVGAATSTDALAVVGQRVWSDGTRTWITGLYDQPDIRRAGRKSLVANPGLMFYASGTGKLFHRSIIEGLVFEGRVLGDQPWTLRALLRAGDRIEVIEDVVYEWDRPAAGSADSSITSRKQGSASLAAESVRVAIGAFRDVCAEADRVLEDPGARRIVAIGYATRLVRADFAGAVERAVTSADPAAAELFHALTAWVRSIPAEVVEGVPAIAVKLLAPPLRCWGGLSADARSAVIGLVRALPPQVAGTRTATPWPWTARWLVRSFGILPPSVAGLLVGSAVGVIRLARRLRAAIGGGTRRTSG